MAWRIIGAKMDFDWIYTNPRTRPIKKALMTRIGSPCIMAKKMDDMIQAIHVPYRLLIDSRIMPRHIISSKIGAITTTEIIVHVPLPSAPAISGVGSSAIRGSITTPIANESITPQRRIVGLNPLLDI